MTAGEGGIICSNDKELITKSEALMWAGRRVGRPWYEFERLGWNYRMTEFQAAILNAQLTRLVDQVQHRQKMARHLSDKISRIEGISPLVRDERATLHGYHLYILRYDEKKIALSREKFIEAICAEGLPAQSGYTFPIYKNPMFLNKTFINGSFPLGSVYHEDINYADFEKNCPVSERACNSEAVWLPQNMLLGNEKDMDAAATAIVKVIENKNEL